MEWHIDEAAPVLTAREVWIGPDSFNKQGIKISLLQMKSLILACVARERKAETETETTNLGY